MTFGKLTISCMLCRMIIPLHQKEVDAIGEEFRKAQTFRMRVRPASTVRTCTVPETAFRGLLLRSMIPGMGTASDSILPRKRYCEP